MRLRLCVVGLLAAEPAWGLSRGFGKSPTPKKAAAARKKKPKVPTPPTTLPSDAAVDKWGVPLDWEERLESERDAAIAARCRRGLGTAVPPADDDAARDVWSSDATIARNTLFRGLPATSPWQARLELLHADPLVLRVRSFLSDAECESLTALSETSRAKAMPKEAGTFSAAQAARRTSTTYYARFQEPEVAPLLARAAALFDVDWSRFEEVQLARYQPGERFKWHLDAVPPSMLAPGDGGQRLATVLVYLTTTHSREGGGCTTFRDLSSSSSSGDDGRPLSVSPRKGDALVFFPAVRDGGRWVPDDRLLHAADPVVGSDEKWVSQLWIHESAYPAAISPDDNPRSPDHAIFSPRFSKPPPLSAAGG